MNHALSCELSGKLPDKLLHAGIQQNLPKNTQKWNWTFKKDASIQKTEWHEPRALETLLFRLPVCFFCCLIGLFSFVLPSVSKYLFTFLRCPMADIRVCAVKS